jgi:hypothetical protein
MDMSEIVRTEQADSIHAAPREAYTLLQNMETLVESRRCDEEQIELCDLSPIHSYTEDVGRDERRAQYFHFENLQAGETIWPRFP